MKAVNLIPRESRRSGVGPSIGKLGASHLVIALLVIAVGMVTAYVLTNNTVSKRKAQLATLQQQVTQMQAQVDRLTSYEQFEKLAQARAQTVQEIASSRFDWYQALSDLSKVVPANTSFQSLAATASPTSTTGGTTVTSSGSGVRGDINAPAFSLKGCTGSQDEVAQLMSRLRLINGVTRVTLEDSNIPGGTTTTSSGSAQPACSAHGPTFDMVVFFQPVGGAASTTSGQTVSTSTTTGASK